MPFIRKLLLGGIRLYQFCVAPALPTSCRFAPTCSHYAVEAIRRHGVLRGLWLAGIRVAKCHPYHPGGLDPVP